MSTEKENLQNADGNLGEFNAKETENNTPQNSSEEEVVNEEKQTQAPENSAKDYDENADVDQQNNENEEEEVDESVELKDYDEMSLPQMVAEGTKLLNNFNVEKLKEAFQNLKEAFDKQWAEIESEAKEKFLEQGGNEIDFRYESKDKNDFKKLLYNYKNRLNDYYKSLEKRENDNLKERENITEELKALYTEPSNNNSEIFKKFRVLKTRWHNAGRIPKAKANNIFNNYYFHLDNFYKFLDLNQELRKMDYEHNLNVRKSIISRAEKLLEEANVQKALNELQYLHRMWKEEAVPVAEEHREPTWQKFKELTARLHERKVELSEEIQKKQQENLAKKKEIIQSLKDILNDGNVKSHNLWQRKIKEVKKLREKFFAIGRVPKSDNQPTWDEFKEATKNFNSQKNAFYKEMKAEQMGNLEKKRKLIEIANEHKDSTNWNESVKIVKKIQSDWKKIGHVPRKYSDKIWEEFNDANNQFFDRYKNRNNERLEQQSKNLEEKLALLKEIKTAKKPTEKEELINWLNECNIRWSSIGFVPNGKQEINKEFTQLVHKVLKEAGLNKNAIERAQWDSQLERIKSNLDNKLLRNLKIDLRKRIDDKQREVSLLQNNLAFFSNADESNPLFKSAISNIENHVNELNELKSKYDDLRLINLEALAESQEKSKKSEEE